MHELRAAINGTKRDVALASKPVAAQARRGGGTSLTGIRIKREEARKCDQRREDRHLKVIERATIRCGRVSRDVGVINVSARGAMVESDLEAAIGARVEIRFADCNRTECFVRWIRDGRIGLEFARETLIIGPAGVRERIVSGRREGEQPTLAVKSAREPRQGLILRGELHWHAGSMPVRLRNISRDGAMLEATCDLPNLTEVVLELSGVALPAEVRWCRSRQIGIRFESRFDLEILARPRDVECERPEYLKPDYLKTDGQADSPWAGRWDRLSPDTL